MADRIEKMKETHKKQTETLQAECHHPKDAVLYSVNSFSPEDDYGRCQWDVTEIHEEWECEICGKREVLLSENRRGIGLTYQDYQE